MFVGREHELKYLNDRYLSNQAEMIVLYGRRRIGKTELIRKFIENKDYIFYAASEVDDYEQRKRFAAVLEEKLGLDGLKVNKDSWDNLFRVFKKVPVNRKVIIAIDEFPYMINSNKAIPSILQNMWDHELRELNIMILLTGSSVGVMLDDLLGAKNPLYGRVTGSYKLNELPLADVKSFFPNYTNEEVITAYSILGGVPQYLLSFNPEWSVEKNIKDRILTKGTYLYDEVQMLMKQELREATTYFTILEAVAMGNTKLNQIHQMTQIEKTKIATYLSRLIHLDIVEREHPVTEKIKKRANVQTGLYKLKNNYFRFYFKYLFPNTTLLELQAVDQVYKHIVVKDINVHVSQVFEEVCINYVMRKNLLGELPIFAVQCGRWWYKQNEIDMIALDGGNRYIFGECKWRNEPMKIDVLTQLQKKISDSFEGVYVEQVLLFSKSGFDQPLVASSEERNFVKLVTVEELLQ